MAYTKVAPSKSSGASIVYARDGKDNDKDKCVAMSGLNCDPSNAEYEFAVVRRAHNKALKEGEDIQARLIIQSFEGEELSPEEVNEMGYELAENINEKLGGGFQAVVYTHGNTKNLHNHIVFNSVNADTGKKYTMHYEKFEIEKMSDEIVSERGLNVIEKQKKDITTNGERKLRENGQYVWKDDLKDRFNRALDKTLSNLSENRTENVEKFKENLSDLGVSVKERYVKKRDTTYFTYAFTDENGKKQTANEKRLGTDFSAENVIELTQRQLEKNKAKTLVVEKEALETPPDAEKPKKRTGFVPPVEIEKNRIAEISQNKPLEEQEKEKEIQTTKEDKITLETPPKPLKNDFMFEERERIRKEKLELIAKKVGLDREGNFKTPVLFVEHADKPVRYTYLSSELKRSERGWSSEIAKENVKFDYYVSPHKKLFSAEYRKENGESLYQTCRKGADREDVSAEFEKAHTKVKQANMSKGRSKSI